MSSPGTYSRCCTNSTEWPKNGLLCMPEMNPSTTWRARRSRRLMRASVSGWRKRRGSSLSTLAAIISPKVRRRGSLHTCPRWHRPLVLATLRRSVAKTDTPYRVRSSAISRREDLLEALVAEQVVLAAGRLLQQPLDDGVGGDA